MSKRLKTILGISFSLCLALAFSSLCMAAEASGLDIATAINDSASELAKQGLAIIGGLVGTILSLVGAKMLVVKSIGWFKALAGKA